MTRAELHRLFVSEFHCEAWDPQTPATLEEIAQMESELNTKLPEAYVTFMLTYGSAYTPEILRLIVDGEADMPDLKNIEMIPEAIAGTKAYWSAGTPDDLIGFGGDSGGNMFCFKRYQANANRPDDLPVWYFDHEFVDSYEVSPSFDEWLLSYIRLKRTEINE
jgi:hypothetical protein